MLVVDDRENDLLIHKLYASMGHHDEGGHVKVKKTTFCWIISSER